MRDHSGTNTGDGLLRAPADVKREATRTVTAPGAALLALTAAASGAAAAAEPHAPAADGGLQLGAHAFFDWSGADLSTGSTPEDREITLMRLDMSQRTDWGAIIGEVDLANQEFTVTDAFAEVKLDDHLSLRIGQFKEPNGLEQIASNYGKVFTSSAGVSYVNGLGRRLGVGLRAYADEWTLEGGVFASNINEEDASNGWSTSARAVWSAPISEGGPVAHLGGSLRYRESEDDPFAYGQGIYSFAYGKSVKTSAIAESDLFVGLEGAFVAGSFQVTAEASRASVECGALCASDPQFDAAYVDVSYVFGGHRQYSSHGGKFGRYVIDHPLGEEGGHGAWELAARYDYVDLEDAGVLGGNQTTGIVGLTYHANANARLQFNYAHSDYDAPLSGVSREADAVTVRLQLDFSYRQ
ncbi:MAG: OprO/OprP family phosphate-selective porin [Hyphomonadaceae bacterium]|nr:OprO/OprP family phosphate-selective porin [Hyphomonadaceae bacterium]